LGKAVKTLDVNQARKQYVSISFVCLEVGRVVQHAMLYLHASDDNVFYVFIG